VTKKITVTMPDELHARLEKVRGKFNISGICQGAIEKEIKIEELSLNMDDDSIIERLKLEKSRNTLSCFQRGRKEGSTHAKGVSYLQLRAFYNGYKFISEYYGKDLKNLDGWSWEAHINDLIRSLPDNEKEFKFCKGYDIKTFFDMKLITRFEISADPACYVAGFIKGLASFYENIQEQIGDI